MAVARLDAAASVAATTQSYPVSAGSDRMLVVAVGAETNGDNGVASVDYGGQAMVAGPEVLANAGGGFTALTSLWYILEAGIAAASGSTITPTFDSARDDEIISAASYTGVNQAGGGSTLLESASDSVTTGTGPITTVDLTEAADNLIVAISCHGTNTTAAWQADMTEQTDQTDTSSALTLADRLSTTGANVTIECTWSASNRHGVCSAEFAAAVGVSITDVETDEDFRDGDTALTITGQVFEAAQGTGKVEISDNAVYATGTKVAQTVESWADTAIDFEAVLGALAPGPLWIWVTNDSAERNTAFVVTVHRKVAFILSATVNVPDGGEATTALLTAPAGKTSGANFDTGRRWDDENGTDTLDHGDDDYTEYEWWFEATADASGQYEFRVVIEDTPLTTYTVTPKWTIDAGNVNTTARGALLVAPKLLAVPAKAVTARAALLVGADVETSPTAVTTAAEEVVLVAGRALTITGIELDTVAQVPTLVAGRAVTVADKATTGRDGLGVAGAVTLVPDKPTAGLAIVVAAADVETSPTAITTAAEAVAFVVGRAVADPDKATTGRDGLGVAGDVALVPDKATAAVEFLAVASTVALVPDRSTTAVVGLVVAGIAFTSTVVNVDTTGRGALFSIGALTLTPDKATAGQATALLAGDVDLTPDKATAGADAGAVAADVETSPTAVVTAAEAPILVAGRALTTSGIVLETTARVPTMIAGRAVTTAAKSTTAAAVLAAVGDLLSSKDALTAAVGASLGVGAVLAGKQVSTSGVAVAVLGERVGVIAGKTTAGIEYAIVVGIGGGVPTLGIILVTSGNRPLTSVLADSGNVDCSPGPVSAPGGLLREGIYGHTDPYDDWIVTGSNPVWLMYSEESLDTRLREGPESFGFNRLIEFDSPGNPTIPVVYRESEHFCAVKWNTSLMNPAGFWGVYSGAVDEESAMSFETFYPVETDWIIGSIDPETREVTLLTTGEWYYPTRILGGTQFYNIPILAGGVISDFTFPADEFGDPPLPLVGAFHIDGTYLARREI